ncbi:MAG: hypothetical protein ACO20H_01800 [Bacteriovoracaceae bacterium]
MKTNLVRCFVIADDYKWHVLTDSIEEFFEYTKAYLELMNSSKKENHYFFKNIFLDEVEFRQIQKNMSFQNRRYDQSKKESESKECHLRLVE